LKSVLISALEIVGLGIFVFVIEQTIRLFFRRQVALKLLYFRSGVLFSEVIRCAAHTLHKTILRGLDSI